jgi:hypothetical protein
MMIKEKPSIQTVPPQRCLNICELHPLAIVRAWAKIYASRRLDRIFRKGGAG